MREARPWNAMDPLSSLSSDDSSTSDSDEDEQTPRKHTIKKSSFQSAQGGDSAAPGKLEVDRRKPVIDYEALSRHGYSGGPSVLRVPPPRPNDSVEQDWSWSGGKRKLENEKTQEEESYEEREKTRRAVTEGAPLSAAQGVAERDYMKKQRRELANEHKSLSFSQKEKRKRDLGQASRGKNYVEEEKRLLREQGVYSGFDK